MSISISSCASSLSSDDNTTNIKSILKSEKSKIYLAEKYEKRVVQKRSLLHSFERPSRNIDSFVKTVLNYSGKTPEIDSDESYNSLQKPKKESSRTGRKKSTGRNTRSLSLDRDKYVFKYILANSYSSWNPFDKIDFLEIFLTIFIISIAVFIFNHCWEKYVWSRFIFKLKLRKYFLNSVSFDGLISIFDKN